ncbi:hypothetical protein BGZ83_005102 [Gryganskiella cystojenkinii]|nr:hypothetical protein BGZ83_005102 [Gryganskiella cystojenkinii]
MFVKTAFTFSALILASLAVGVVKAQAPNPPATPECRACLNTNFNKIPDCLGYAVEQDMSSIDKLTPAQKKCLCALSKTPQSTWSQGCVSDTMCSQQGVDAFGTGIGLMAEFTCAADAGVKNSAAGLYDVKSAKVVTGLVTAAAFALL